MEGRVIVQTVMEILMILMAVIGFYCVLREVTDSLLLPRQVTAAVVLHEPVGADSLDILLSEAIRHPVRRRGRRVLLLIPRNVSESWLTADISEVIERYHAAVLAVDTDGL